MGFGGGALAANQVIRNNRNLLKSKRKSRGFSFVSEVQESWIDPKKASFEQLMEIRRRIRREHKVRQRKVIALTIVGFILLVILWNIIPWDLIFTNTFNPNTI